MSGQRVTQKDQAKNADFCCETGVPSRESMRARVLDDSFVKVRVTQGEFLDLRAEK